ncbi:MAG: hypothetical protein Kow0069_22880 [Promethearchaeota archaeon]
MEFITENDVERFLDEVEDAFPTFVGGVVADENGFLVGGRLKRGLERRLDEESLALAAVANRRLCGISERLEGFQRVKRQLGEGLSLLVVLRKEPQENLAGYSRLKKVLKRACFPDVRE